MELMLSLAPIACLVLAFGLYAYRETRRHGFACSCGSDVWTTARDEDTTLRRLRTDHLLRGHTITEQWGNMRV